MNTTAQTSKVSTQVFGLASAFVVAALIALCPSNARANTIVFNNLGPGDTYSPSGGYSIHGVSSVGGLAEPAAQFTAGASGFLTTVDLGLGYHPFGGLLPVRAYIYGDAAGSPDNANQIFLGSGTPTVEFGLNNNNSIVSITVAGSVPVTMGSLYWLVLKPGDANTFDVWNWASPINNGNVAGSGDDSFWGVSNNPFPAFRITARDATAVPDSGSTWPLLLFGLTATVALKFFARQPA